MFVSNAEDFFSYNSLIIGVFFQISCLSATLSRLGVSRGDRVMIYMPMIPQSVIAMLATVRLGAIHSVVFGGTYDCDKSTTWLGTGVQ